MKVMIIGCNRRVGISQKNNRPYDICEINYLNPDKPSSKKDDNGNPLWDYTCYGHRVLTIKLNPTAMAQFASVKYPHIVDLIIEPEPENPARNWAVGLNG